MDKYIATREGYYNRNPLSEDGPFKISPGTKIDIEEGEELSGSFLACTMKLDTDLLKTAFMSSHYANWLSDKRAEQAEDGSMAYPGLKKSSETLIMYLVELGVSTSFLLQCIYGEGGNKYMELKYLVQEFGKMI